MLKMMEAFSYASEYWDMGLWVKASSLTVMSKKQVTAGARVSSVSGEIDVPGEGDFDVIFVDRETQV